MEPRYDESQKVPESPKEERKRRFRIVKLEERIAPARGGKGTNQSCAFYGCGDGTLGCPGASHKVTRCGP